MTPDRVRQIETLYHAVREAAPDDRAALLANADPEVRRRVESLLKQPLGGELLDRHAIQNVPQVPQDSDITAFAPGSHLGPYRIESRLGAGGMGEVFRAIDTRLGRAVAIKTVREQFNARFQREARAISSLNHANICILHDVGPNYLVMELVEGETIAARLKRGAIPAEQAILYAKQIASALEAAHAKGIIHRDLKPGNVMLTLAGAKVLDFGLATLEGDQTLTAERMVMGTPAYMAPEQWAGRTTDARTDIYAFGWIIYEMLTGERASPQRQRIRTRRLEAFVNRCLEENPGSRWQSATELQRELAALPRISPGRSASAKSSPRRVPKPVRKASIVLGEFENRTGNSVFDGILRQSLSVQLEESAFLTPVSDQQIQQVLRLMQSTVETRLTSDVAQEICDRIGGVAVLEGSVASLGGRYILWLRARNCGTGDILAQEQAQAGSEEEVLNALTRIATRIRERMEESLAGIRGHSAPLQQVTTPSLEALRAYSASRNAVFTRGLAAAIPHLERAIEIDPQFAMAHADLGFHYWNMGQTDRAIEPCRKAWELRDRVSDQERYFILFLYDRQVTGNLQRELETIESWLRAYPRDWQAWGVLPGWGTRGTGQYERGLEASRSGLRLYPALSFFYDGVATHAIALGRFGEAAAAFEQAASRGLDNAQLLVNRYYLAFLLDDTAGMKREVDRAHGSLEAEGWMAHNQALVLARRGQMRAARLLWRHTIEHAHQTGQSEKAAIYYAAQAVCEAHSGISERAVECAHAAVGLAKGRDVRYAAAFAFALSGEISTSQGLTEDLAKRFPEDTPVQFEYLPVLRALFALHHESPAEAIDRLQTALPYDFAMPGTAFFAKFGGLYPAYVRGLAYMKARRGREAAAEFQKMLDHRGIVLADPIGALAHLQLGRALVLSGETDKARSAYDAFFTTWRDADPDLPLLQQANAEYVAKSPS
jgi:serine/threonine protein kinase/tetratricopeptide (TPR) repeat protein